MDVGGGWGEKRKTFLPFSSPFIPLFRSRYNVRNEVSQNLLGRLLLGQYTTNLKASRAPFHKLNGSLGLDCRNSCIHILRYYITTEQQTASHIFAVTWVTFHHLIGWLKTGIGDFSNTQLFMVGFFSRDNWSISGQWEVNTWIWNQVGLKKKNRAKCSRT